MFSVGQANLISGDLAGCQTNWSASTNINRNIGQVWLLGGMSYSIFNTVVPPNSTQFKWNTCRSGCGGCGTDSSNYVNAQSYHSGGANFLLGDGSVKFIKDSVAWTVYWGLGTKAGGEVIDAASY